VTSLHATYRPYTYNNGIAATHPPVCLQLSSSFFSLSSLSLSTAFVDVPTLVTVAKPCRQVASVGTVRSFCSRIIRLGRSFVYVGRVTYVDQDGVVRCVRSSARFGSAGCVACSPLSGWSIDVVVHDVSSPASNHWIVPHAAGAWNYGNLQVRSLMSG